MQTLQDKQQNILNLASASLFGTDSFSSTPYHTFQNQTGEEENTIALIPELSAQAVLPLILPTHPQSTPIIANNLRLTYEQVETGEILAEHRVDYVILKGVASASYYPNPILRTMGDVDLHINYAEIPLITSLLHENDFVEEETETGGEVEKGEKGKLGEEYGIHTAFHREDSAWEMHRKVNDIPSGPAGKKVEEYLNDIISTAVEYETGNSVVMILDDFHHGLVLLLHTASHLTSDGVGLRHLCDWAAFVHAGEVYRRRKAEGTLQQQLRVYPRNSRAST